MKPYLPLSLLALLALLLAPTAGVADPGKRAADFNVPSLAGGQLTMHGLAGKVVLLDFWASWCEPCKQELPELQRLQQQYAGKVVVVAMNIDQQPRNAERLVRQLGLTLTVGLDSDGKVAERYDPPKMPSSFVVDRGGVIRFVHAGFDGPGDISKLRRELDQLTAN